MENISVIVPIYHGKKYINNMIRQIEANANNTNINIELIFVNDDPAEPLDEVLHSDVIDIKSINLISNQGIHNARVKGLEGSKGEYILFLDQDDKIVSYYFESQLRQIGAADAVACGMIQNNRSFYNKNRCLNECISKEYMIQKENGIISPGQVLIKKRAIPQIWTSNILVNNGADDWMLWICMLCDNKKIIGNEEILFEHVLHSANASSNTLMMFNSMCEVFEILRKAECCSCVELEGIQNVIDSHAKRFIYERDKFLEMYILLDEWMKLREKGISISEFVFKMGHNKVAVYGRGRLGVRVANELQENGIQVVYFIDLNAESMKGNIQTILPDDIKSIDVPIIMTLVKDEALEVKKFLMEKGVRRIYLLTDIIFVLTHD